MFYTEITETTCKTVRFSGIYGLYVNNGVQKTYFFDFGYWRPWVRVPPLRPRKKDFPCGSPSFFAPSRCTDLNTVALATWVRILRAERVELARKRQA